MEQDNNTLNTCLTSIGKLVSIFEQMGTPLSTAKLQNLTLQWNTEFTIIQKLASGYGNDAPSEEHPNSTNFILSLKASCNSMAMAINIAIQRHNELNKNDPNLQVDEAKYFK